MNKRHTSTLGVSDQKHRINQNDYAKWLNDQEWEFFCTFTTQYELTLKSARRMMDRYFNVLKRHSIDARVFWVAEPFELKHGCHLHALVYIGNKGVNQFKNIKRIWKIVSKNTVQKKDPFTVIKGYDKKLGANHYVAKYLGLNNSDHDILI